MAHDAYLPSNVDRYVLLECTAPLNVFISIISIITCSSNMIYVGTVVYLAITMIVILHNNLTGYNL